MKRTILAFSYGCRSAIKTSTALSTATFSWRRVQERNSAEFQFAPGCVKNASAVEAQASRDPKSGPLASCPYPHGRGCGSGGRMSLENRQTGCESSRSRVLMLCQQFLTPELRSYRANYKEVAT